MTQRMPRRLFAALLANAACTRHSSGVRIVVGGQTDLVYLPTTLAQQLGFFAARGVNASIDDVGAGSKALEAILGRSADVATGFYDHAIQMAAEGRDIKAFVTLTRYPGAVLVTSPGGAQRIKSIKDLKGGIVGVTAPGSSSHFFVNHLLLRNGLQPDDVRIFGMGGGRSRIAAIESGHVDAGVLFEPGVSILLERAPNVKILADTRTEAGVREVFGVPEYPSAVLYASAAWLNENAAQARQVAGVLCRTLDWIQTHSAADIAAKMPPWATVENGATYVESLQNSKPMYSLDGRMRLEAAAAVHRVLSASLDKVRETNIDVEHTYTNEFVSPAAPR